MSYPSEQLKSISLIKTGKLDSNAATDNGIYPFFTCDPQTLRIDNWAYDTEAVLLAGNNASGNYTAKYYRGKFNAYQRTYIIETVNPKIMNTRFLCYAINQKLKLLRIMSSGSTTKFLTIRMLHDLEIPCPKIEIQEKISNYLGTLDDLIETNQRQIKLLEEAAQRLYKEWFVDLRYPGHENVPVLDGVPAGWKRSTIDSRISLLSGYAFKSTTFVSGGKYKLVTIKNVKDGEFDGSNVSTLDEIPTNMPVYCFLEEGDILLSLTGNVGRVCLVFGDGYLLNQRVAKIKSDIPGYSYCLFRSKGMYTDMNNLANGAAQQNLSPVRTGKLEICIPSETILSMFEKQAGPILRRIVSLSKENAAACEARDHLLPKLMSGEIEV